MEKKRKYKPLTNKAKLRLALVIAASVLIIAMVFAGIFFAVKGLVKLIGNDDADKGGDSDLPAVSTPVDIEPVATVVLDPGHGGSDGGAVAKYKGTEIIEKDLDEKVALKVKILLESANVEVLLTREEDVDVSLKERTAFANEASADLFVSLHCNTSEEVSARGLECYYEREGEKGKDLAENITAAAAKSGQIKTRDLHLDMMYVVRFTEMPSTLVEMGFMSNDEELALLCDDEYQQILAEAIADGILKTLGIAGA